MAFPQHTFNQVPPPPTVELPQHTITHTPEGICVSLQQRSVFNAVLLIKHEFRKACNIRHPLVENHRWDACAAREKIFLKWLEDFDPRDAWRTGGLIDLTYRDGNLPGNVSFPLYYNRIIDSLLCILGMTIGLREELENVSRRTRTSPELKGPALHVVNCVHWDAVWKSERENVLPPRFEQNFFRNEEINLMSVAREKAEETARQLERQEAISLRGPQVARMQMFPPR